MKPQANGKESRNKRREKGENLSASPGLSSRQSRGFW